MTGQPPGESATDSEQVEVVPQHPILVGLASSHPAARFEESITGQNVFRVGGDDLVSFVSAARDAGFNMFIDLTAVDYHRQRPEPRFDLVISLLSLDANVRLRVLVGLGSDSAVAPSITGVYPGANFFEREVFDLFGITFTGHPDLTRILMPDDWEGAPLRKDYPVGSVPVQFRDTPKVQ